jgi:hypothetical protein
MANQIILDKIGANDPIFNIVAPASCANGYFVALGTLGTDGTYTVAAPAAVTTKGIVMVLEVPLSYQAEYTENDFVIATGAVCRAYAPVVGRKVSIPVSNITATATVQAGAYIVPDAGAMKPECLATLGGTEEVIYVVESVYTKAGVSMAKIRCIKAY